MKHQFWLSQPVGEDGGGTLRDALLVAAQTSTAAAADLEGPEIPAVCRHVWDVFQELHRRRSGNGYGPNPITFVEMRAYDEALGKHLSPAEYYLLTVADDAFLEQISENRKSEKKT